MSLASTTFKVLIIQMLAVLFQNKSRRFCTAFLHPSFKIWWLSEQSSSSHHNNIIDTPNQRRLFQSLQRTSALAAASTEETPADRRTRRRSSRSTPATLDSWDYDDEFGAFDYVPDEYDLQDMNSDGIYASAELAAEVGNQEKTTTESSIGEGSNEKQDLVDQPMDTKNEELEAIHKGPMPIDTIADAMHEQPAESRRRPMTTTSEVDVLEQQLQKLRQKICDQTSNPELNPNSPRQVSEALFGESGGSTNKDVLEAMAGSGNKLASQMLQFRQLAKEINKRRKRQESKDKGTFAKSVYSVKRANGPSGKPKEITESTLSQSDTESEEVAVTFGRNEDPLLLVDASAYIFRAYYAFPPLHRSDGMPVGAVLGFCNMLNRLVLTMMMEGKQPRIVLVFDAPGKTFRHGIYELYKANRVEAPVDLIPQFGLIREAAKAYGIVQLEAPSFEADDVIATLATMALKEGIDCNILSGDKDLMQLVTRTDLNPSVQMIDPMSMSRVSYEDVIEKWGVAPELLGDVLALAGDSSDNVPGVPGIGPKIAADLITSFGSLENLLEHVDDVKQNARREKLKTNMEQARLSRVLVELDRQVPMDLMAFPDGTKRVADLRMSPMDADRLVSFFDEMGLRDLKRRFQNRLELQRGVKVTPKKRSPPFAPRGKTEIPRPEDFSDVPF